MLIQKLLVAFTIVMQIVGLSSLCASDYEVLFPSGWSVAGSVTHAVSPFGVAVVAFKHRYAEGIHGQMIDRSLVIQARPSGATYETEFDGKIFAIRYSASGEHLLVHQVGAPDVESGPIRAHLLDDEGRILWSKVHPHRLFHFSATGEVVYAWYSGGYTGDNRGRSIELFDLDGYSIGNVEFDFDDIQGVVVPADGQQVILVTRHSIVCAPVSIGWKKNHPKGIAHGAYVIDPSRFVVQLNKARAIIVNVDGTIEYTYDPEQLGTNDPAKEPHDYAAYRMFAGPFPGTVTLFDGSAVTYTLTLSTGDLEPRKLDTTRPEGFTVENDFAGQRMVFSSRTKAIIRAF